MCNMVKNIYTHFYLLKIYNNDLYNQHTIGYSVQNKKKHYKLYTYNNNKKMVTLIV
jgi:hypothetical protein